MKVGSYVQTPRFGGCRIQEVFESREDAWKHGYKTETFVTTNDGYGVAGKTVGYNLMVFAAYRKGTGYKG